METFKIESRCYCGFLMSLDPQLIGRKGKCPSCGSIMVLPRLRARMRRSEFIAWKEAYFPKETLQEMNLDEIQELLGMKRKEPELLDPNEADRLIHEHPSSLRERYQSGDQHPSLVSQEEEEEELELLDPKEAERWMQERPQALREESSESSSTSTLHEIKERIARELKAKEAENSKKSKTKKITSWESCLGEGVKAYKNQDFDQAIQCFTQAIELHPQAVKAFLNRGLSYYEKKQYDLALLDYQAVIELEPENEKAHKKQIQLALKQKDHSQTLELLKNYLKIFPKDLQYHQKRIDLIGNHSLLLIEALQFALQHFPDHPEFLVRRAYAYFQVGEIEKALTDFLKICELEPDQTQYFFNAGSLLIELERYEEAIDLFSTLLEKNPNDAQAYHNRGFCYQELGLKKLATKDFDNEKNLSSS